MARSVVFIALFAVVGIFLVGPGIVAADDVPDEVRAPYDQAKALFAKGDLKKAFSAISKGKAKAPPSVDFWHLYVRIWRGLDKDESTLWDKIVAKAEAKNLDSTAFDLLRYRLAEDAEKRVEYLQAALAKDPKSADLRLKLAREHLANDEEDQAEEILDQVLEDEPANETALVIKGDLMIASGFSRSAIDFAEETLAEHDLPGLHDLEARGYLLVAKNDASAYEKALAAAKKAVAGRPDPGFVLTLSEILDKTGKEKEAVVLLTEHYERTTSPDLAGRLGEMAFRTGDYEKAAKGLAVAAPRDRDAALALALCEARRGRAKEARAAVKLLLRHGKKGLLWAVGIERMLGDTAAALAHAEASEEDWVGPARAVLAAENGDAAAVVKAFGDEARDGTRGGEEWLVEVARARLLEKLGAKAGAARKLLLEAGWAAGKAGIEGATRPTTEPSVSVRSFEYMQRHVTYRRSLDGEFFASGDSTASVTVSEGSLAIAMVIIGVSNCPREKERHFRFNETEKKVEGDSIDMEGLVEGLFPGEEGDWEAAEQAFTTGAGALVDGNWASADQAFGQAFEKETGWARAKLFQAVARALAGTDLEAASKLATEAVKTLPEDWDGRELSILVQTLAGKDAKTDARALAEARAAFSTRRYDEFWYDEDE